MLNKYREEVINQIINEGEIMISELPSLDDLEDSIQNLQAQIRDLNPIAKQKIKSSFFFKLFNKKKLTESIQNKQVAQSKIDEISEKINSIYDEIYKTEKTIEKIENKNSSEIEKFDNTNYLIQHAQKNNPQMFENEDFVKDCIDFDINNVALDKTTSNNVNIYFVKKLEKIINANSYLDPEYVEKIKNDLTKIEQELQNPKPVAEDKFKIPHRYIIESLLKNANNPDPTYVTDTINMYQHFDGKLSKEQGQQFDNLYSDKNHYLYVHNIIYRGQNFEDSQIEQVVESICKNGLRLTTSGNEIGKLEYTTLNTHDYNSYGFLNYLEYWSFEKGIVVMQIPKHEVDSNYPIIGCNYKKLDEQNPGYLLPKYVLGYLNNGQLKQNPYKLGNHTEYSFTLAENKTSNSDLEI